MTASTSAVVGEGRRDLTGARSLQALWLESLELDPAAPAVGFYSRRDQLAWRSRTELHHSSLAVAAKLSGAGLAAGQVCVIVLPSDETAVSTVLGVLLLGAVPLLVAPPALRDPNSLLPEAVSRTARRARARLVVRSGTQEGDQVRGLVDVATVIISPEDLEGAGPAPRPHQPGPGDVAAMQLTSGTTGFPKICVWSQKGVLAALDGMGAAMGVTRGDVCFNWTPLYHDMGLVNNLFLCLAEGMPLVMMSPHDFVRDPGLWLRGLDRSGATITWSPNFGFALAAERVADDALAGLRLDRVRAFWNAAERIHLSTMERFHQRFACYGVRPEALKTNFGCAENVGGATFSDLDAAFVMEWVDRRSLYEDRLAIEVPEDSPDSVPVVSAGRPHPRISVEILSSGGDTLGDGEVGEIALRTPSRMIEYLGDEEATGRAIQGPLLRTGDLGYRRGPEVFWVGRVQERITVRGKKLDPSDFEPVLFRVEGLRPGCFVAFGVDDPAAGTERVVVVSEVREPLERPIEVLEQDIRRGAFSELAVSVDEVVLVPPGTLTKTSSGKRRHRHFKELYLSGSLPAMGEAVPR